MPAGGRGLHGTVTTEKMKSMKCRFILVLCVLAALLAVASAVMSPVRAEPPRFSVVALGIAHAVFKVRPADAEPFSGHAFKIDLDVAELRLVPAGDPSMRRTVEEIVAPYAAVVAVNASFFDKDGRAMGLAVDEGRLIAGASGRAGAPSWSMRTRPDRAGRGITDHLAIASLSKASPVSSSVERSSR